VRYTDGMAVRVRVLGGLAVEGVDLGRLSSRKARRLLSRLAIARGASVSVDTLAQVVWGDELPSHPADQLSVLVSRLRSALGADRLTRTQAGYTLMADWLEGGSADPEERLTPRELEVVKLIAEAFTNRQIAETLKVSEKTVESHRANVLSKLGMRDRVELVRYAIRRGLVEP